MRELSYKEAIRTAQTEWRNWRANGADSLRRKHQTIEVPTRLAQQFQETIIDALPVSSDTKSAITAQHPPLIMGWALGPDDRKSEAYRSNNFMYMQIPRSFSKRKIAEYMNGILWVNELITSRASRDTLQALHNKPMHTKKGLLSRAFLNADFVQSDMELGTAQQTKLAQLLQDPNARANIFNAWFSNDHAYMNRYLSKSAGMSLTEMTIKIGKIQNYNSMMSQMTEKNANGGGYQMGHGIAHVQGPWPWAYTVMTAAPFVIGKYIHLDSWSGITSAALFASLYGKLLMRLNQMAPSALAHETVHYLAEGEKHMGWYAATYGVRRR
ncbi:hypothetical protein KBC80_04400 [Candidatus Woesebacteria bacterium]|nr:hypothetical protein [Candidatus Woesebacteria bacterium]